jgi:tetratricopeptide (TPR) repeat protein
MLKTKATLLALALFSTVTAFAQAPATPPAQPQTPPKITRPADEDALQKAASIKDLDQRTDALIKFVADFPKAVYIRNAVFYFMRPLREMKSEPEKIHANINRFVEGTKEAPVYARNEFYYGIARDLLGLGILPDLAAELAEKGTTLLNEEAYVDNERRAHEQKESYYTARDPKRTPEVFSPAQAKEKFRTFRASNYAALGNAYIKLGKLDKAEAPLKQAYEIKPIMEAGTGLADLYEKRGQDAVAFDYLAAALLSGRMPAEGIERTQALYRKMHGGKIDGFEADLDARHRRSFRNPLKVEHYKRSGSGSANNRATLAEFVTGAGCEPCTAVDISFDAALERYSRRDLVLLVYHMHAPTSDPMSNHSAQARHKFYNAVGAPTIYLDGQNFKAGEGLATESEHVYKNLDAGIAKRLDVPAQARILLNAKREGSMVKVSTTAEGIKSDSPALRLQIALVENEVSYSGENGLRFHPMVVRNLARPDGATDYGFAVNAAQPTKIEYSFDLEKIVAENLKYYDDYIADMKKRLGENFRVTFKEKRYLIDRNKLSVVAFVQDEKTKDILQATYLNLSPTSSGGGK